MNEICPIESRNGAITILTQLREAGFETYFAGGCVRDRLLSDAPTEYDIATSARPEDIKNIFPKARSVGEAFGVMLVRCNDIMYDVATFRSDGPYSDHRHPDKIQFSDAEHDAQRRDFTINGMFEDPIDETIIDFVNGRADMDARLVRAIGNPLQRIEEDHLRMLRAIRFASRFEFSIEDNTAEAIREVAHELAGISKERIGEEVKKMLLHPNRGVAAWEMQYLGLDRIIFAEASCMNAPTRLGRLHAISSYANGLAAWILDRNGSEADVATIAKRWRVQLLLSNKTFAELTDILTLHRHLLSWDTLGIAKQKRSASSTRCTAALAILQAEDRAAFIHIKRTITALKKSGIAPAPFINGNDLLEAGIAPSPSLGIILENIYDAQLEGSVTTRDGAISLGIAIYRDLQDS
jgi:poly(A) polymerase